MTEKLKNDRDIARYMLCSPSYLMLLHRCIFSLSNCIYIAQLGEMTAERDRERERKEGEEVCIGVHNYKRAIVNGKLRKIDIYERGKLFGSIEMAELYESVLGLQLIKTHTYNSMAEKV